MVRACRQCKSEEIEEDTTLGNAVCTNCGAVLEENVIVSDVQFQETSGGGHSLIGQYVTEGSTKVSMQGKIHGTGKESREITLQNAKRKVQEIASQLRLNQHCMDTAFAYYRMALQRGVTKGRKLQHIIACCLYMTCRLDRRHLLLLDFSDAVQVNVYELGKTCSFLCRSLHISMPPNDPCDLILRFAHQLQFGDKEQEVCNIALRLVQRMKQDWIAVGRRPSGICGAALMLAARYHNFNRSLLDIVRVVHCNPSILKKRLDEFAETPAAALTMDEFVAVDLESAADPPAYTKGREDIRKKTEQQIVDELAGQFNEQAKAMDAAFEAAAEKRKLGKLAGLVDLGEIPMEGEEFVREEVARSIVESCRTPPPNSNTPEHVVQPGPTLHSLGITPESVQRHAQQQQQAEEETEGKVNEDSLSDIDDSEIDVYILTESESKLKTRLWMNANGDYLQRQEERRSARREAEEQTKDVKKRRRRRTPIHAATKDEAIEKVIQEKKLSNKINYDVLRDLTAPATTTSLSSDLTTTLDSTTNHTKPQQLPTKSATFSLPNSPKNPNLKRKATTGAVDGPPLKKVHFKQPLEEEQQSRTTPTVVAAPTLTRSQQQQQQQQNKETTTTTTPPRRRMATKAKVNVNSAKR